MEVKDIAGLAPFGDTLKLSVEKGADAISRFYTDLCQPAVSELGLYGKDIAHSVRLNRLARIADKAKGRLAENASLTGLQLAAPDRLVSEVVEGGSRCEDEKLQDMWAGLLASSLTPDGTNDSNIIYLSTLRRLTSGEAKLIEHVCVNCRKGLNGNNEVQPYGYGLKIEEIKEILQCADASEVQSYLGHLRSLELLMGAGMVFLEIAITREGRQKFEAPNLTPSRFGLHFFVRCQGSRKTLKEYFNVTEQYNRNEDTGEDREVFTVRKG
jgi:hypothetical protein